MGLNKREINRKIQGENKMVDKKVRQKMNERMKVEKIRKEYAHIIETMMWK